MRPEDIRHSVAFIEVIGNLPQIIRASTGLMEQQARPNHRITTATAFFYRRAETVFVGTNRHVFQAVAIEFDKDKKKYETPGHSVRITVGSLAGGITHQIIPFKNGNHLLWKGDATADLALLPFVPAENVSICPWTAGDILPADYELEIAEPLISMGYPLAFHDNLHNRPIFRHGSMASEYGVDFKGQPYFLTDINHFPGNSGSPVVTRQKQHWRTKAGEAVDLGAPHCLLCGVHSRREHVPTTGLMKDAINLGLGVTWYARLVENLAGTF